MTRSSLPLLLSVLLVLAGCHLLDGHAPDPRPAPSEQGLVTVESERSVAETTDRIVQALQANDAISIVARIDHAANAESAGLSLRPTRVILFGNPQLGTPLMQNAQTTGIDLPQKMLVWKNKAGRVFVTYNASAYLKARHDLDGVDDVLNTIGAALRNLAENASGGMVDSTRFDASAIAAREGLVVQESAFGVDETYRRLKEAIQSKEPLSVLAELDHQANAASVGLELRPTRLLVFGNPALGTPLMQRAQSIGIDLPQKVLVYEDADGQVHLAYNDPFYLADRHGIDRSAPQLATIAGALEGLAMTATTEEQE